MTPSTRGNKKTNTNDASKSSSKMTLRKYPGHLTRGFGQGFYSVGKGFYDGLGEFVEGIKAGGTTVKGGVKNGVRNVKQKRVVRAPLRMVDGVGMGVANLASGTVRGIKTTAHGFVQGGRSVVRGVTGYPLPTMQLTMEKKEKKSPTKAVRKTTPNTVRKASSTPARKVSPKPVRTSRSRRRTTVSV